MKILVTGGNGQLAQSLALIANISGAQVKASPFDDQSAGAINTDLKRALLAVLPEASSCLSPLDEVFILDRQLLDICNSTSIAAAFKQIKPDVLINCAAYNAVDKALLDVDTAYQVNAIGPELLGLQCKKNGVKLIHISTDFVFAGNKGCAYDESDSPSPLSVYGKSKLAGEQSVQQVLGAQASIIRTAWLYSCSGHNFVNTMLGLFAVKDKLSVIGDQYGSPTWSEALAVVIFKLIIHKEVVSLNALSTSQADITDNEGDPDTGASNLYHYAAANTCSWFEFAKEIQRLMALESDKLLPVPSSAKNALGVSHCQIKSISAKSWQALHEKPLAKRPSKSALNIKKLCQHLGGLQGSLLNAKWQQQLKAMLDCQRRSQNLPDS
ncbi:dTDP-4-dehydrorhamnose reductase [Shewanella sp. KX20019]|uniref:dTDP-4-dehydrorhamnose reductase n=1 Tax=Shewanella sp. KX20019 TaxID=2803864 RepID=UPI00192604D5|nr:dTDP-4-dehydrorhamnose reductase [Shewanella sp. KX20019]QQX81841.1 dTDP-4-dehydrorhamnose reductase [Shewanella sp. KX20019]